MPDTQVKELIKAVQTPTLLSESRVAPDIIESQNCRGWKRALISPRPTDNPPQPSPSALRPYKGLPSSRGCARGSPERHGRLWSRDASKPPLSEAQQREAARAHLISQIRRQHRFLAKLSTEAAMTTERADALTGGQEGAAKHRPAPSLPPCVPPSLPPNTGSTPPPARSRLKW